MKNNSTNNGKSTRYSGKNRCKITILLAEKLILKRPGKQMNDKSTSLKLHTQMLIETIAV